MVSGHPLDGLKSYINSRTSGVQFLRSSLDILNENLEKALLVSSHESQNKTQEELS